MVHPRVMNQQEITAGDELGQLQPWTFPAHTNPRLFFVAGPSNLNDRMDNWFFLAEDVKAMFLVAIVKPYLWFDPNIVVGLLFHHPM